MKSVVTWKSAVRSLLAVAAFAGLNACSAADMGTVGDEQLTGAEETGASVDQITASYPTGSTLETTAALNLRSAASTSAGIILVMPRAARVTTVESAPHSGWYHIRYGSHTGWSYGGYLRLVARAGGGGGGSTGGGGGGSGSGSAIDGAIARARAGVGFSYWWGEGRWLMSGPSSSTRGACYGSCGNCRHAGSYGADCSGYVSKIWQVPSWNNVVSNNSHPYSTYNFRFTDGGGQWFGVSRSSARRGDAFVYHSGSEGHIFLYDSGDPWGWLWAYEAKGCSYGIQHDLRTASSSYRIVRRRGY